MNKTAFALSDANVRIQAMIYVPGLGDPEAARQFLDDMCNDLADQAASSQIFEKRPALATLIDSNTDFTAEDCALALGGDGGFLFQAATPVIVVLPNGTRTFSWSQYWTEWLSAADEADIAPTAIKWATARQTGN